LEFLEQTNKQTQNSTHNLSLLGSAKEPVGRRGVVVIRCACSISPAVPKVRIFPDKSKMKTTLKRLFGSSSSSSASVGTGVSGGESSMVGFDDKLPRSGRSQEYHPVGIPKVEALKSPRPAKANIDCLLALPELDRKKLAVQKQVVFRRTARGECILKKGEQVKCVYVLLSGLVMVFRSGNNYADYSIGPGDLFGDEAFTGGKSSKTFRAANDIHYCEVEKDFFVKNGLFVSFRELMKVTPGGGVAGVESSKEGPRRRRVTEERDSVTATNSSRNTERGFSPDRMSDEGKSENTIFFGTVGAFCNFNSPLSPVPPAATVATGRDAFGDMRSPTPVEKTPRTHSTSSKGGDSVWCFIPDFFGGV
jgi:hypothetical protein